MEVGVVLAIVLVVLMGLLISGVPVAFALATTGVGGLLLLQGSGHSTLAIGRAVYSSTSIFSYIIIPLFLAMGVFARDVGLAEDAYALARRMLRRVPGNLAIATVAACAGFAAVSGSSVATLITIGRMSINEMLKNGYDPRLATGIVAVSGTLGVLIPPSALLVLYGILARESIGGLLIAGIIPGLLSAGVYVVTIIIRAQRNPELVGRAPRAPGPAKGGRGRGLQGRAGEQEAGLQADLRNAGELEDVKYDYSYAGLVKIAALAAIVVGGIYLGIFTVTESAGIAAVVAFLFFVIHVLKLPGRRGRAFMDAFRDVVSLNGMAFALIVGAGLFTLFLVAARIPQTLTTAALSLDLPGWMVVAILLLAFVPLGMFLDPVSIMLLGAPLAYPVVTELGFDGLWFGIMMVKMIEFGLVTPPVGINAYVVGGIVPEVGVEEVFRGVIPFYVADLAVILLLFAFPAIVTFLPHTMR